MHKNADTPTPPRYHPEINETDILGDDDVKYLYYQLLMKIYSG
jgi:hypothetical protein